MKFSKFGENYTRQSAITQLMEDIAGHANNKDMIMLGGGNPANIPETYRLYAKYIKEAMDDEEIYKNCIERYSANQGDLVFIDSLAEMFRDDFGIDIHRENIALTTGSQSSFFMLFNMLAGKFSDGSFKKVLFPLIPEYVGYGNSGLYKGMFVSQRPIIDVDENAKVFKYRIDFEALKLAPDIGAVCVSRPTNPSGNVVTDSELRHLSELTTENNIPLIVDNAYGAPFPNIIYEDAGLFWNNNMIFCMSLSKLGFPTSRTGIIIANKDIIKAIASMNAIISLAPPSFISSIVSKTIKNREIISLSNHVIKPHYYEKLQFAVKQIHDRLSGYECFVHKMEGSIFLWLWMRNFPITSDELYERLKRRNVIVISGTGFFPGLQTTWRHSTECIRISIAADKNLLQKGIDIISDEIKAVYDGKK